LDEVALGRIVSPAPPGALINDHADENFLGSDASCLRSVMRASQHNFAGVLH
jgi:hypothetical protein